MPGALRESQESVFTGISSRMSSRVSTKVTSGISSTLPSRAPAGYIASCDSQPYGSVVRIVCVRSLSRPANISSALIHELALTDPVQREQTPTIVTSDWYMWAQCDRHTL